jgi:opacity protein-like surface antigen
MTRGYRTALVAAVVALAPWSGARADDVVMPVGHAEYGVGGSFGPYAGFRQNLDLAAGAAFVRYMGQAMGSGYDGWLLGGAFVTGFGAHPTYAAAETGWTSIHLLGYSATIGPALRLDPGKVSPGGEASASIMAFFVRVGLRAIVVADGDAQICGTVGVGVE